jgi:hypothetical protein
MSDIGTPLLLLAAAIYFFPTICAGLRGKANGTGAVVFRPRSVPAPTAQ